MKLKTPNLQTNLNLISAIILLIGLGSALLIYLTAEPESDGALGYEVVDGYVYPVAPENSKMYVRDLELYGGKEAVLANELRYWFAGLWRGKSLPVVYLYLDRFRIWFEGVRGLQGTQRSHTPGTGVTKEGNR